MDFQKFEELEEKLKLLVSEYGLQRKKIQELEQQLHDRNLEIEELNGKFQGLSKERDAVRTKVDSLLSLLHDVSVT
jgi:uncharacterized coiled-coil DUF342 family protein